MVRRGAAGIILVPGTGFPCGGWAYITVPAKRNMNSNIAFFIVLVFMVLNFLVIYHFFFHLFDNLRQRFIP